ncbi:uncharacterized protein LOC132616712 [Lycium barbarum]|uniref:uncharacterized protein LOC132616712 n=1 Tax=Lycium barbarum TaxID=112863 RepID=UPI00293F657B|nr:uncharacterized protein LOC132616712 [Lycium barbarum]
MERTELIFIPGPGMGHLVAAVEIGKLLTSRAHWLSITFFIIDLPIETGVHTYTSSLEIDDSTSSRLRFLHLSSPQPQSNNLSNQEALLVETFDNSKQLVREAIVLNFVTNKSNSRTRLAGVIVDMFSDKMIEVAIDLGLPSYVFFTSSAAFLGLLFYAQTLKDEYNRDISDFKDSDTLLPVSTYLHPLPAKVLPNAMLDKHGRLHLPLSTARMIRQAKGIIINTFIELEPHSIKSLANDNGVPSLYPVGPIINLIQGPDEGINSWLDEQQDSSVLFLCFGSYGSFDEEQLKEIAIALDRSGCHFLWALRQNQAKGKIGAPDDLTHPEQVLPEGFLELTMQRGKVIGWAPQVAVLSHKSIGGFITHCGWNSILESLWFGVPMATWPMYAEQQVNAFELVVDLEMAVDIKMEYRSESPVLVTAEEIQSAIRRLMLDDTKEKNGIRKKLEEMKEKSRRALLQGGSSYHFLENKKKNKSRKPIQAAYMEKLAELIVIPSPAMGHVAQMLELAKLLIHQNHQLSITVLIMKLPDYIDAVSGPFVDSVAASSSSNRLQFIALPSPDPTPEWSSKTRGHFVYRLVQSQKSHIREFLRSQRPGCKLAGFVVDMLCTPLMDVADEFGIPSYVFFTSPAAFLGLMLHFQFLEDECHQDVSTFKNSDSTSPLSFPSYAYPVPPSVLPMVLVDRDTWLGRFLDFARGYRKAKGIIINTFAELEIHALDAYNNNSSSNDISRSERVPLPLIYPIGPILNQSKSKSATEEAEITNWLDEQPPNSVVLICFGSQGSVPVDQVNEIAIALEKTGCRFLWSLRRPPQSNNAEFPGEYTSYSEILPVGFLNRTEKRGKVVGWVPQLKVLSHEAVGGFVSHCGWNSILESIWCGVPIATWPLHSEQQVNAFQLVKEVGTAVEITLDYCERNKDQPMVTAEAIEKGVKKLMETNSEVRDKAKEMKEKSRTSVMEGGSSYLSLGKLIDELLKNAALLLCS